MTRHAFNYHEIEETERERERKIVYGTVYESEKTEAQNIILALQFVGAKLYVNRSL